jgi:hypothetical protein
MSEHTRELRLSEAQRERDELDQLLDQALRQTFPASDPISLQFDRKGGRSVAAARGTLSAGSATRAAAGYKQGEGST